MIVDEAAPVEAPTAASASAGPSPGGLLAWAARGCLALGLAVLVASWQVPSGGAVFVGGWPVRFWLLSGLALLASACLYGAAALTGPSVWGRASTWGRKLVVVLVRAVTAAVIGVVVLAWGVEAIFSVDDTYVTVVDGGGRSCDVVVRERSGFSTSWDLYEVGGGFVLARPIAGLRLDDASRPLHEGRYAVRVSEGAVRLDLETAGDWTEGRTGVVARHSCA